MVNTLIPPKKNRQNTLTKCITSRLMCSRRLRHIGGALTEQHVYSSFNANTFNFKTSTSGEINGLKRGILFIDGINRSPDL